MVNVIVCDCGALNVAVTLVALPTVTLQALLEPEQAPLQPLNVELLPGVSVSVTEVPELNDAEHVPGQLMAPVLSVTVPIPVPASVTVNVYDVVGGVKLITPGCVKQLVTAGVVGVNAIEVVIAAQHYPFRIGTVGIHLELMQHGSHQVTPLLVGPAVALPGQLPVVGLNSTNAAAAGAVDKIAAAAELLSLTGGTIARTIRLVAAVFHYAKDVPVAVHRDLFRELPRPGIPDS